MEKITIQVQGSQPGPYEVSFKRTGTGAIIKCTCQAGQLTNLCKHKVGLLTGDITDVVEGADTLQSALAWVEGTPITAALAEYINSETALDAAKKRNATAKKDLAKAMISG